MATYASTLVIKHSNNKSDAEIIRSMDLHKKDHHDIGEENTSYPDALRGGTNSIYVTSIGDFVIMVGNPLISDFMYGNPVNSVFPDAEYFLFFSESTAMLHGFVWGKGDRVYRRKYVQDGKYIKSYDFSAEFGTPLPGENKFTIFSESNEPVMGIDDYMYGVHDFDIALDFLRENFFKEDPSALLDKLVFNRGINSEIKNYIESSKTKVDNKLIDEAFAGRFKMLAKEFGFNKMPAADNVGKVSLKHSYFKKQDGFGLFIIASRRLKSSALTYEFSIEWDEKIEWVERNTRKSSYGVPFISFNANRYCQLKHPSGDGIYLQSDLDLAVAEFDKDLSIVREILVDLGSQLPYEIFKSDRYYNYLFDKLKENVRVLKRISSTEEINFCILYYFFSDHKKKGEDLLGLLDKIPENENQLSRKVAGGALAELLPHTANKRTGFFSKILNAFSVKKK